MNTAIAHEARGQEALAAAYKGLRWGVVANTINAASRAPRWVHVKRITGFGSTAAQKLCRDAGFDPDEEVGSWPEPCETCAEEEEESEDE